jgi:hypothetical protein
MLTPGENVMAITKQNFTRLDEYNIPLWQIIMN